MTHASIVNFYPDLVGLWGCDLNILDSEVFAGLPSNGSLSCLSFWSIRVVQVLTLQVMVCGKVSTVRVWHGGVKDVTSYLSNGIGGHLGTDMVKNVRIGHRRTRIDIEEDC